MRENLKETLPSTILGMKELDTLQTGERNLEDFYTYLITQLEAIEKLSAPNHETLFKKKLYISFLESLAKATFPRDQVKRRFMKFLENFTEWKEYNNCCPVYINDKEKIQNILDNSWYVNIEQVAISSENLDDCRGTYAYLLYEARNSMVHQLQSSTEWEESTQKHKIDSPFYRVGSRISILDENLKKYKDDKKYIELIFPNTFLKKLSEEGLRNYIKYCKDRQINPFKKYYSERNIYEEKI